MSFSIRPLNRSLWSAQQHGATIMRETNKMLSSSKRVTSPHSQLVYHYACCTLYMYISVYSAYQSFINNYVACLCLWYDGVLIGWLKCSFGECVVSLRDHPCQHAEVGARSFIVTLLPYGIGLPVQVEALVHLRLAVRPYVRLLLLGEGDLWTVVARGASLRW